MELTNFYQFASNNPWLTFFLFLVVGSTITSVFGCLAAMVNSKNKNINDK
jgi:hypothetical protein